MAKDSRILGANFGVLEDFPRDAPRRFFEILTSYLNDIPEPVDMEQPQKYWGEIWLIPYE